MTKKATLEERRKFQVWDKARLSLTYFAVGVFGNQIIFALGLTSLGMVNRIWNWIGIIAILLSIVFWYLSNKVYREVRDRNPQTEKGFQI